MFLNDKCGSYCKGEWFCLFFFNVFSGVVLVINIEVWRFLVDFLQKLNKIVVYFDNKSIGSYLIKMELFVVK